MSGFGEPTRFSIPTRVSEPSPVAVFVASEAFTAVRETE